VWLKPGLTVWHIGHVRTDNKTLVGLQQSMTALALGPQQSCNLPKTCGADMRLICLEHYSMTHAGKAVTEREITAHLQLQRRSSCQSPSHHQIHGCPQSPSHHQTRGCPQNPCRRQSHSACVRVKQQQHLQEGHVTVSSTEGSLLLYKVVL